MSGSIFKNTASVSGGSPPELAPIQPPQLPNFAPLYIYTIYAY